MNILIVCPEYYPRNLGGGGIVYKNLARELKKQGHAVTVLSGNFHNKKMIGKVEPIYDDGVKVYFLSLLPLSCALNIVTRTPPTFSAFTFLIKQLLSERYDMVHLHGLCHFLIDITAFACIFLRKGYVFTCHGIPKSHESAGRLFRSIFNTYLAIFEKFILRKARAVTTVSYALLKECNEKNLTNNNMAVIPNGPNLDLGKVNPDVVEKIEEKYSLKDRKVIFSIGRLAQVKGVQYIIEAMPHVISEFPEILTVIAGSGPYANTLKDLVHRKNLQHWIKLIGWITEEEKAALYQRADVVVFPSVYEPFGIVLLEALTMHKPVVAFNVPPISEIIDDGVDGLLVPLKDEKRLADAILQVLSNDKLRGALVSNTYSKIQSFLWDPVTKLYIDVYTGDSK